MTSKIERRTKSRVDLRLSCRVDGDLYTSENSGETTENISRNGLLLRWTRPTPVPATGSALRVEVELPSDGVFAPRLIRCESVVVRVIDGEDGFAHVGLRVNAMRFVESRVRRRNGILNGAATPKELVN